MYDRESEEEEGGEEEDRDRERTEQGTVLTSPDMIGMNRLHPPLPIISEHSIIHHQQQNDLIGMKIHKKNTPLVCIILDKMIVMEYIMYLLYMIIGTISDGRNF